MSRAAPDLTGSTRRCAMGTENHYDDKHDNDHGHDHDHDHDHDRDKACRHRHDHDKHCDKGEYREHYKYREYWKVRDCDDDRHDRHKYDKDEKYEHYDKHDRDDRKERDVPSHYIHELEKSIKTLADALATLGRGAHLLELQRIIHHPGWTSPAELAFVNAILDHLGVEVRTIERLQADLVEAARKVKKERH